MLKESYGEETNLIEKEAKSICEIMLFGVFEDHLKKLSQVMQLNCDIISRSKDIF